MSAQAQSREAELGEDIILETKNVVKRFGGVVALAGVSVKIPRKWIVLLIGPNGSGKTTLVNVITGFLKPEEGRVFYEGKDITGMEPHLIARMGIVRTFQIPKPFVNLTVLENLLASVPPGPYENPYLAVSKKVWEKVERDAVERAFEILKILGMERVWDQKASSLSGAELKLLEVGRALMSGAKVMIMDEPAAGVNPAKAHEIFSVIRRLREEKGITFLIIEHRIDIAAQYVDYAYAMHLGRIISQGRPEKVLSDKAVIESYIGA
jgi:branched-chain amino acid transport system ATP-binding protein